MQLINVRPKASKRLFPVVRWVLMAQFCASVLMAGLVWAFWSSVAAGSVLAGGVIAWMPNLVFSLRFGFRDDRQTAKQVARRLYQGECLKLLLTAGLFAGVFSLPGVEALPLMGGYVWVLTIFWFALLVREHHI
ncbi:MAG: ATP synthase subunit I [Methylococcus sp.]|jgi:ATP synthase protein I